MARAPALVLALCTAMAACAPAPPAELSGLWSANEAACAVGVGVRFRANAVELTHDDQAEVLLAEPRYARETIAGMARVRITYSLPRLPGGAHDPGARGVVVLVPRGDGSIAPLVHNVFDGRTGAVRMRVADDPALQLLTLKPCGPNPWRGGLRGLSS